MVEFMQHVPLSAILILGWLVWKGLRACRDAMLPVSRAVLWPLAMLTWSVWHVVTSAHDPMLSVCWLLAAGTVFAVCRCLRYPAGLTIDSSSGCVRVTGSPVVLVLMLVLYLAHFVEEAFKATHPHATVPMGLLSGFAIVYGGVAGVFIARLFELTRLVVRQGLSDRRA